MLRTIFLALAWALAMGLSGGQISTGIGSSPTSTPSDKLLSISDPNGAQATAEQGNVHDPSGAPALVDAGNHFDPNGASASSEVGGMLDPDGK